MDALGDVALIAFGAGLSALSFYAGWRFRDAIKVAQGEAPALVAPPSSSVVLEDWYAPAEEK